MLNGFTNAHEYVRKLFHNNIQNVTNPKTKYRDSYFL